MWLLDQAIYLNYHYFFKTFHSFLVDYEVFVCKIHRIQFPHWIFSQEVFWLVWSLIGFCLFESKLYLIHFLWIFSWHLKKLWVTFVAFSEYLNFTKVHSHPLVQFHSWLLDQANYLNYHYFFPHFSPDFSVDYAIFVCKIHKIQFPHWIFSQEMFWFDYL